MTITSRHNRLAQLARDARDGRDAALLFAEGLRLCEEAARSPLVVEDVLFTADFAADARGAELLAELRRKSARLVEVSESVLASVADTKSPQGVALLGRRPACDLASFERWLSAEDPLLVVLHGVGNPANAGAMLRVAEAAGASGVVATAGTTDLLAPKSLRGAMGSAFRLPLWEGASFGEVIRWCAARGVMTVGADPGAGQTHTEVDWAGGRAIICGAEARGLSHEEAAAADVRVRIPMRAPVESLNVAAALAVLMYEAARQRGFPHG